MALTHALSTNNYGPCSLIVATSAANGTHTTLASAMADASVGDTIFLRDSVTENVTITPGVNIAAWSGGTLNTPSITGTLTMTAAGTSTISGLKLTTNSAAIIAVTGSAASILNVNNCNLNCSNNTGITFSTSSGSARINISNCMGDIGTTGIAIFSHTSGGTIFINNSSFTNSGVSTTANTISSGGVNLSYCNIPIPITTSSTAAISLYATNIATSSNTTALTHGGSGTSSAIDSTFQSGSASAVSIGDSLIMSQCTVNSTNTNAITGAGTLVNGGISFISTSSKINTSTQTARNFDVGGISFDGGTNILSTYTVGTFTPTMVGTVAGTTTYSAQNGYYIRIGSVVTIQATVIGSAATGTGNAILGNFPFTIKSQTNGNVIGTFLGVNGAGWTYPASTTAPVTVGGSNSISAIIYVNGSAAASAILQMANSAFNMSYTLTYEI